MMEKPPYFEPVRQQASRHWDQLEADPVLAGPWHQLFMQVQIPRHVVSELLQNADDAKATEASIDLQGRDFVFSHNGEDFTAEHFTSLCRFGYSNKRHLHTIGFRGVGFKSTFSLGDEVRLTTPTLSVAFRSKRFTEPIWIDRALPLTERTQIDITVKDEHRLKDLERNLADWLKNPASLLFFRHIRRLHIVDGDVSWHSRGPGPVTGSERMALSPTSRKEYLLFHSHLEHFPADCIDEILEQRVIRIEDDTSFPPCRVDIVLGMKGRLFVILPTEVETKLPFACNGPFIQDPARLKIKDVETSPTNRWLLKRIGELAAESMLAWLNQTHLGIDERARAYALLSDLDRDDTSPEGLCGTYVEEAIQSYLTGQNCVLSESGELVGSDECVSMPWDIRDVWEPISVSRYFKPEEKS